MCFNTYSLLQMVYDSLIFYQVTEIYVFVGIVRVIFISKTKRIPLFCFSSPEIILLIYWRGFCWFFKKYKKKVAINLIYKRLVLLPSTAKDFLMLFNRNLRSSIFYSADDILWSSIFVFDFSPAGEPPTFYPSHPARCACWGK